MTCQYYVEQARSMSFFALSAVKAGNLESAHNFRKRRDEYIVAARRYFNS